MTLDLVLQLGPIRIARPGLQAPGAGAAAGGVVGGVAGGAPGADLVIAFASVGHDPARGPSPEFVATALGRGLPAGAVPRRALFVMDDSRSWGNAPEFAPALRAALADEAARAPLGRVATIGQSMGGYAALVAAQVLPVDAVLAFGPQSGVGLAGVPGETRWADWTARLPERLAWPRAPMPELGARQGPAPDHAAAAVPAPRGVAGAPGRVWLFHGATDDLAQARAFAPSPRCDHLIFAAQGHSDLVPHLKARGCLGGLVAAALVGDRRRLLRIAASAGGVLRARFEAGRGGPGQDGIEQDGAGQDGAGRRGA